jgi:hypothetical protein
MKTTEEHTPGHIDCPACEAAGLQVIAEATGKRLTPTQFEKVVSLAAKLGIRPTEVITRALRAYSKKVDR